MHQRRASPAPVPDTAGALDRHDIGDHALSFAEVKALASGDPLILDKATADAERTRLERLQGAYQRNQHALRATLQHADARITDCAQRLDATNAAMAARVDTRGDAFAMTIEGARITDRADARAALTTWANRATGPGLPYGRTIRELGEVGQLGGIAIDAQLRRTLDGHPHDVDHVLVGGVALQLRGYSGDTADVDANHSTWWRALRVRRAISDSPWS